jgi:hypothetical protein
VIEIILQVRVNNAADRIGDRVYSMYAWSPGVPRVGEVVCLGKWRPQVAEVRWYPPTARIDVVLKPDSETFKGGDFARQCAKWEGLGFSLLPDGL